MAKIASGIVETKILRVHAVCCEWAGWALHMADGVWHFLLVVVQWRS